MFNPIDPETANGPAQALLATTRKQLGRVPNLYRAMANSPTALSAYLAFRGALQGGALDVRMHERIALLTAQRNHCDYCIAAHYFRGSKIGMTATDLDATRHARSDDPKIQAALAFVVALIDGRGVVPAPIRQNVIDKGWSEAEIGEMVAHVALNMFSNYFKQIAEPALDFPPAPALI